MERIHNRRDGELMNRQEAREVLNEMKAEGEDEDAAKHAERFIRQISFEVLTR